MKKLLLVLFVILMGTYTYSQPVSQPIPSAKYITKELRQDTAEVKDTCNPILTGLENLDSAKIAEISDQVINDILNRPTKETTTGQWILYILGCLGTLLFIIGAIVANKKTEEAHKWTVIIQRIIKFLLAFENKNKKGGTHE